MFMYVQKTGSCKYQCIPEQLTSGDDNNAKPSWLKGSEKTPHQNRKSKVAAGSSNTGFDTGSIKVEVVKAELSKETVGKLNHFFF